MGTPQPCQVVEEVAGLDGEEEEDEEEVYALSCPDCMRGAHDLHQLTRVPFAKARVCSCELVSWGQSQSTVA